MARTNTSHGALEQQFDLEKMVAVLENRADNIPVVLYTGPADLYTDELANTILQDIPAVDRICLFVRPHPVVLMENRSGLVVDAELTRASGHAERLAALAMPQLLRSLSAPELTLLVTGGVLYTAGAVVLARAKPDPRPLVFGYHEIWARAWDQNGNTQPPIQPWNPKGYLGNVIHRVPLTVARA